MPLAQFAVVTGPADPAMLRAIVPPAVVVREATTFASGAALFPEEVPFVSRAVERRVREFATGRALAREALAQLAIPAVAIPCGPSREPVWPKGVVGSITHCQGYCAVALGTDETIAAVGIDAEPNAPLPIGVRAMVTRPEEHEWLDAWSASAICADRVLFSAKESVYKAWFSITKRWLGFDDVIVTLDFRAGDFIADLNVQPQGLNLRAPTKFKGRFIAEQGYILTAVIVWRPSDTSSRPAN